MENVQPRRPITQRALRLVQQTGSFLRRTFQSREIKFDVLSHVVRDAVIVINPFGQIDHWNPAAEKLFGYSDIEAIGMDIEDFFNLEVNWSQYREKLKLFRERGMEPFVGKITEGIARTKNGDQIPVEFLMNTVQLGEKWFGIVTVRDISRYKEVEAERIKALKMAISKSQLATMGQLAAGVIHDANNFTSTIVAYAKFVLDGIEKLQQQLTNFRLPILTNVFDELRNDLNEIQVASERMTALNRAFMGLGQEVKDIKAISFSALEEINSVIITVQYQFDCKGVTLETQLPSSLPKLKGYPQDFRQIIINLIMNALDATSKGGKVQIYAREENGKIIFEISDSGHGIPEYIQERMYKLFYTTKAKNKGSGLGLPLAKSRIEKMGGKITFITKINAGTTFFLEFHFKE